METITAFFKAFGDATHVVGDFPVWLKVFCVLSALYVLIFGAVFIYYYARHSALLNASDSLTLLEQKALQGDSQAMMTLSFSKSPRAFDVLASVIRMNLDEKTRVNAISALSNTDDPRKVQVLGDTLVSEKWTIAGACAQALGRLNDPKAQAEAVPYLLRALELRIDWVVAQKSAEALGNYSPTDAVARALVMAMDRGESFEAEAAMQSLVRFGDFSLPYLLGNLRKSTSAPGLKQTIHALKIIGIHNGQDAKTVHEARSRINTIEISDAARKELLDEFDRAFDNIDQSIGPN